MTRSPDVDHDLFIGNRHRDVDGGVQEGRDIAAVHADNFVIGLQADQAFGMSGTDRQ